MRYRVEFIDANGKVYFLRGIDYKPAADAVADKVGTLQQLHAAGERPTPELVAWIRDCRPEWRARMIRAGLVDAHLVAKGRPLAHHLIGWWHALKAKGRTRDHARKSVRRAIAICRGAELRHLADMCVGKVETHLAGMRDNGNGINASTYNAYLQAIRQFTRWMMTTNRADADPLANAKPLERAKVRKECRRERRAMTPDEMRELLARTAKGPERYGAPAADRRLVYWLAAMTGLRVRELKSLRAGAFDLASKPPAVTIQARSAKNATTATLPLPADLAEALRPHMASKTPGASAFDLPHPSNFARMLADDLDAARLAWIADAPTPHERAAREQSDHLAKDDHEGRAVDFHALRHTRGVWLFQHHNATAREAQELMRVSSVALVDRYARSFRLRDMSLIDRGPELNTPTTEAAEANGTDHAAPLPDTRGKRAQENAQVGCGTHRHLAARSGPATLPSGRSSKPTETRRIVKKSAIFAPRMRPRRAGLEPATAGLEIPGRMKQGAEIPKESARFCESGGACAGECAGGAAESCPETCGRDHLQATAPELAAIIDTLAQLPEGDRLAIADHVAALVGMSADRRAAVFMLARPE